MAPSSAWTIWVYEICGGSTDHSGGMARERLLKARGIAAWHLIRLARRLLAMPRRVSGDFDTCFYCRAPGCESGTAEHAPDCPSSTGVFVVTLQDLWPGGPSQCGIDGCDTTLWPGDSYSYIEGNVGLVACLGCAARHELLGDGGTDG